MRKSLFALAPVALVLLATTGAQAASNAQITITANVVAATCDVSLSTNNLDLGNHAPSAFTAIGAPITASLKNFTVGLNNCDTPLATADTANLVVSGETLGGSTTLFNSTGTNNGITLALLGTPTTYIEDGQKLLVATAGATPAVGDFNTKTLTLQAGLASSAALADIGAVKAPILFSFAYN